MFSVLSQLVGVFIDNILPIFLVASIGVVVGRWLQLDPNPLSTVIFYIFSPALIFQSLVTSEVTLAELAELTFVMALIFAVNAIVAYLVIRRLRASRVERAGIILSAVVPNNGNLGLPLIDFAFGTAIFARAVVIFVATTILTSTVGVYVASSGRSSPMAALANIIRVPVVYAVALGLIVKGTAIALPLPLERSIQLPAQAAVPGMLILLGLQLSNTRGLQQMKLIGVGSALRLLVGPAVALAIVLLLQLEPPGRTAVIMQASMPVAVSTTIYAAEFNLNHALSSSTVLVSTLASLFTLSGLILVLQS